MVDIFQGLFLMALILFAIRSLLYIMAVIGHLFVYGLSSFIQEVSWWKFIVFFMPSFTALVMFLGTLY